MSWSRAFEDPIPLPRGHQLVTLAFGPEQLQLEGHDRSTRSDHNRQGSAFRWDTDGLRAGCCFRVQTQLSQYATRAAR
jgi:hypothetical protein